MTTVASQEFVGGLTLAPMERYGRGPPAQALGIPTAVLWGNPGAELTRNEVADQALIPHLQVGRTIHFTLLQSPVEIPGPSGHLGCHLHGSHGTIFTIQMSTVYNTGMQRFPKVLCTNIII